jgi:hypothetical protein
VDARHEQVGAWVAGARVLVVVLAMGTAVGGRATVSFVSLQSYRAAARGSSLPAVASIGRGAASSRVVQVAAGRAAPVAVVSTGLVYALEVSKPSARASHTICKAGSLLPS